MGNISGYYISKEKLKRHLDRSKDASSIFNSQEIK